MSNSNSAAYTNVSNTVERFMSGALDKEVHHAIMKRAVIGAIVMALPFYGVETVIFAIVLWNMYSKVGEISHVPFKKHFVTNLIIAVVVNLAVALSLCWIPVADEIASAFVAFLTVSLSGSAYVAALKKVHGNKCTSNINFQKGVDAVKQNKEIDGYSTHAIASAERASAARSNVINSWENKDYKGCVDACGEIVDTFKNCNNLESSYEGDLIEDAEPIYEDLPPSTTTYISKADHLKELKSLLDSGVLTQEEFNAEKAKILRN